MQSPITAIRNTAGRAGFYSCVHLSLEICCNKVIHADKATGRMSHCDFATKVTLVNKLSQKQSLVTVSIKSVF